MYCIGNLLILFCSHDVNTTYITANLWDICSGEMVVEWYCDSNLFVCLSTGQMHLIFAAGSVMVIVSIVCAVSIISIITNESLHAQQADQ